MNTIFRIRELLQAQGMTQAELAKAMELKSPSTITMWESGNRNPTSEILPRLADVLGCTIDELYEQDSPEQVLAPAAPAHEKTPPMAARR